MVDKEQDWEYGLRAEGHGTEGEKAGPVVIGENGFHYRVSGENWGRQKGASTGKERPSRWTRRTMSTSSTAGPYR